jgi:hypothetical protein
MAQKFAGTRRVSDVMERRGIDVNQLIAISGVEDRVVLAIVEQRYTPSPEQRQRIAKALHWDRNEIWWGHATEVTRLYGPI